MGDGGGKYGPIRGFADIQAWQMGREIRRQVYAIARALPDEERYGLAAQMRRAAVSVTANIAEGCDILRQLKQAASRAPGPHGHEEPFTRPPCPGSAPG